MLLDTVTTQLLWFFLSDEFRVFFLEKENLFISQIFFNKTQLLAFGKIWIWSVK